MLSAGKSAKIRRNTGQKTRNGRKAPPREYSGRPYLMTKKSRCLTGNGIHIKIELVCALFSFSFLGRCLSGRSLGCGSFSCSCFSSRSSLGSRLARTTRTGSLFSGLSHIIVEVYQLDEAHLRSVISTETGLDDAGIATGTVANLCNYFTEQFRYGNFVLQIAEHYTTRVGSILLCFGDQRLSILLSALAFARVVVILLCLISEQAMLESIAAR